jgi:hypothetical protein
MYQPTTGEASKMIRSGRTIGVRPDLRKMRPSSTFCRRRHHFSAETKITQIMKIAILILVIAFALYILIPGLSWAEDGRAVHGARRSSHFLLAGQEGAKCK